MTMGDPIAEIRAWQRAYEWELARDVLGREVARAAVRRHTHDLFDHIQIVELASGELGRRAGGSPDVMELVGDVGQATVALKAIVQQLAAGIATPVVTAAASSRPTEAPSSTDVEAPCRAAIARIGVAVALDLQAPGARVRGTAEDLEHLIAGVLLENLAAPAIALLVRERTVDSAPWLEIVCTTSAPPPADPSHELRIAEAIAGRNGGELSVSEARGGGTELVVALPCAPADPG